MPARLKPVVEPSDRKLRDQPSRETTQMRQQPPHLATGASEAPGTEIASASLLFEEAPEAESSGFQPGPSDISLGKRPMRESPESEEEERQVNKTLGNIAPKTSAEINIPPPPGGTPKPILPALTRRDSQDSSLGLADQKFLAEHGKEYRDLWLKVYEQQNPEDFHMGVMLSKKQRSSAKRAEYLIPTNFPSHKLYQLDVVVPGTLSRRERLIEVAEKELGRKIRRDGISDALALRKYRRAASEFLELLYGVLTKVKIAKSDDGEDLYFLISENFHNLVGEFQVLQQRVLEEGDILDAKDVSLPMWGTDNKAQKGFNALDFEVVRAAYIEEAEQFLLQILRAMPRDSSEKLRKLRLSEDQDKEEEIIELVIGDSEREDEENQKKRSLDQWESASRRRQEQHAARPVTSTPARPTRRTAVFETRQPRISASSVSQGVPATNVPLSHPVHSNRAPAFQGVVNPPPRAPTSQSTALVASAGGPPPGDGSGDDSGDESNGGPPRRANPRASRSRNGTPPPRPPGRSGNGGGPPNGGNGGGSSGGPPEGGDPDDPLADYSQGKRDPSKINIIPHFDPKLKLDNIPQWDGNMDRYWKWLKKINALAEESAIVVKQLGSLVPRRLTGTAEEWYFSQTIERCREIEFDWPMLRQAINEYYLTRTFLDEQRVKARAAYYRDPKNRKERPSEFVIRKMGLLDMCFTFGSPTEMIREIQSGIPTSWLPTLARMDICVTIAEFQNLVKYHEETLIQLPHQTREHPVYGRLAETVPEFDVEEYDIGTFVAQPSRPPYRRPPTTSKPKPPGRPVAAKIASTRTPPSKVGARPCRHCGKDHWDNEHPEEGRQASNDRVARARLAQTSLESFLAEVEYEELCDQVQDSTGAQPEESEEAENENQSGFEEPLQATQSSDPHASPSADETMRTTNLKGENISEDTDGRTPKIATAFSSQAGVKIENKKPKENRTSLRKFRKEISSAISRLAKNVPSKVKDSPVIHELRARMARPPGSGFLGVKPMKTKVNLVQQNANETELTIDTGSDITLISEDVWNKLENKPKQKKGLDVQLIEVTGSSKLNMYCNLPVYFHSSNGPVLMNVEAYIVKNMSTPLILGNDFAEQYSLSIARFNDETSLHFEGTDRCVPVQESSLTRAFSARVFRARAKVLNKFKFNPDRSARRRTTKRKAKVSNEVRAKEEVVIPPESVKRVSVDVRLSPTAESMFIEKRFMSQHELDDVYATPDTFINRDDPFVQISNFSKQPVRLQRGVIVGTARNPKNWLTRKDQISAARKTTLEQQAEFLKTVVEERLEPDSERETQVRAEYKEAHTAADGSKPKVEVDSSGFDPVEGGPKTAELPEDLSLASSFLSELDINPELPQEQKNQLQKVIGRNERAFGIGNRLGEYPAKVEIPLKPGFEPISLPPFPVSPAKREVIDRQMNAWLELGVISPSKSPWGAPCFIVYRNEKPRMVIDYRKLNELVIPDEFPLPRQEDILHALSGTVWLSTLDALAGFTQLEILPEHRERTAFRSHRGLHHFNRMPFGFRNGPSVFQRVMQNVLAPYLWIFTLVYIDDIVIYSKDFDGHLRHVDLVLKAVAKSGITLSVTKCHFGYQSLLLLGQKVSRLGMSTHKEKVDAIIAVEAPQNTQNLYRFLGMMVYFSSYIPFYAWIAAPLFDLLKKEKSWEWTELHQEAFELCKEALTSAPVRAYPIIGLPYRLYTDACDYGLAGILQQVQPIRIADLKGTRVYERLKKAYEAGENVPTLVAAVSKPDNDVPIPNQWHTNFEETTVHIERVIAYWSRVLKPAERNYSPTEREALALKESLIKYQVYVEGAKCVAITDHAALTWSRTFQNVNRRLSTWGLVFAAYPLLSIYHRAGRVHSNVDPISRLRRRTPHQEGPTNQETPSLRLGNSTEGLNDFYEKMMHPGFESKLLSVASRFTSVKTFDNDPDFGITVDGVEFADFELSYSASFKTSLVVGIEQDELKRWTDGYASDPHFSEILGRKKSSPPSEDVYPHYHLGDNGLIYFEDALGNDRLCVPTSERLELTKTTHDSVCDGAHSGYERTYNRLVSTYYWPRMSRIIKQYTRTCDVCQKAKPKRHAPYGRLQSIPIPDRPFKVLTMDFISDLPESEGMNNVLNVVCKMTKFLITIPCITIITAEGAAELMVNHVFCYFGLAIQIILDRDPRWISSFWTHTLRLMGIKRSLTTSYHPQADGQTEILNQYLEIAIRSYIGPDRNDWVPLLKPLMLAYNSSIHTSTGFSPAFLLCGFEPNSTWNHLHNPHAINRPELPLENTGGEGQNEMYDVFNDAAEDFVQKLQAARKEAIDSLVLAQSFQKRAYNRGRLDVQFNIGDQVLVNPHSLRLLRAMTGKGRKFLMKYDGPFEVSQKISPVAYRIRLPGEYRIHPVINIAHLELYHRSPDSFGDRPSKELSRGDFEDSNEFEIDCIIGDRLVRTRGRRRARLYRVRYSGYGPEFDEWQPIEGVRNALELLNEYKVRKAKYLKKNPSFSASFKDELFEFTSPPEAPNEEGPLAAMAN